MAVEENNGGGGGSDVSEIGVGVRVLAVEENNGGGGGGGSDVSKIGVGMRVLAVDDDPTCLAVLAGLLRKCKYQVTATNQPIKALKLLREDKTRFDLVISDVSMPDMDGFKLLELVGIEMDLPVIMLSQYSDKEFVYKGVKHGAVDYLVKPVRLDMLQNIWQHVIRKKTPNPRDQNNSADNRGQDIVGNSVQGAASSDGMDSNAKLNRKRKDQDDVEHEGSGDNGNETDEHGNQKKPRVVWSVDLHKKFVAAVNQLGFEKAVPKKILDLMNVEGLTRENVASHLQKYRLYLKRLSAVPPHHGNMVGAFGASDAAFLRMGSLDGYGDFRSLSGPGRVSKASFSSYMAGGMPTRLNTPGGLTLHGITNSGLLQGHSQSSNNSLNIPGKLQPALLSGNQATSSMLHGAPSSLQPNQLHGNSSNLGEFNGYVDKSGFTIANGFPGARVMPGSLANTMSNVPGNHLMQQVNSQHNQNRGSFANQPSLSVPSSNQQSFEVGISGSSSFMDQCSENWQIEVQLSKLPSATTPIDESMNHAQLSAHNLRNNISTASSLISNNDIERQAGLIGNVVLGTNYALTQRWEDLSRTNNPSLVSSFGNMNSMVSGNTVAAPLLQGMDHWKRYDGPFTGQINAAGPSTYQHAEVGRPNLDQRLRSNNEYLMEQTKSRNTFVQNNYDDLDDLMNTVIKRDPNENMQMDGEFAFDAYSL